MKSIIEKLKMGRRVHRARANKAISLWTYRYGGDGKWWLCEGDWVPGANNVIGHLNSQADAEAICDAHNLDMQLPLRKQTA